MDPWQSDLRRGADNVIIRQKTSLSRVDFTKRVKLWLQIHMQISIFLTAPVKHAYYRVRSLIACHDNDKIVVVKMALIGSSDVRRRVISPSAKRKAEYPSHRSNKVLHFCLRQLSPSKARYSTVLTLCASDLSN